MSDPPGPEESPPIRPKEPGFFRFVDKAGRQLGFWFPAIVWFVYVVVFADGGVMAVREGRFTTVAGAALAAFVVQLLAMFAYGLCYAAIASLMGVSDAIKKAYDPIEKSAAGALLAVAVWIWFHANAGGG